jgi:uncharacterized membrane protein YhiD involved in acid resistance
VNPARFSRIVLIVVLGFAAMGGVAHAEDDPAALKNGLHDLDQAAFGLMHELGSAAIRLPLAAALGTVLALRPRRRGSPRRKPAVVQTQIVLAVVGAVIMLVVGASLARAFGIMGVASLVRYRSRIDDPNDAVVMLSALAVGLAAGAGLYAICTFSTAFLVATLAVIEHFQPRPRIFELSIKLGDDTSALRPKIEALLQRHGVEYELRSTAEDEVAYTIAAPPGLGTDRVTQGLIGLAADGRGAVEWVEKPKATAQSVA